MCARRLNYAGGDNLPLYATPEEAMKAGQKRDDEERRRRARKYENLPPTQRPGRLNSAPPIPIPAQQPMIPAYNPAPQMAQSVPHIPPTRYTPGNSQSQSPSGIRYNSMPQPVPVINRVARGRPAPNLAHASVQPLPQAPIDTTRSRSSLDGVGDPQQDAKDIQIATQLFQNHDVKQRGRLSAEELQNLLQNDDSTHFCISSVDALINLFGASRFGTVSLTEFVSLYKRVKKWRKVYVDNDINGSFTISASEFHNSLQELGYLVPFDVSENLFDQYAEFIDPSKNGKELKFDRFVETLVWLMRLTKMFRKFDNNQEGVAAIPYKDFIDVTLYLGRFLPH
ncbi:LADA_0G05292g1_1 [Lachancea dasiensis]|uniref:LADA_0G05292g1_1 n=1 Tax=Lachancea dasiensis TaxID=1072105 RepID=A0A1G4JSN8_9SACH|nr:LADA_0G05292g1_1 [Lachancea dasiensis]